jgi:putative transposase
MKTQIYPMKTFYKRNLPHIQRPGDSFFVTFRLHNSIPYKDLQNLREKYEEKEISIRRKSKPDTKQQLQRLQWRYFEKYDELLDKIQQGPLFLANEEIASLVAEQIHRFDGEFYDLIAYCIMSNHLHLLIDTSIQFSGEIDAYSDELANFTTLDEILKRIKGPTAVYANRMLKRTGQFWQRESFDVYIRNNQHFNRVMAYILQNPVKAGLVKEWAEWPYSYLKGEEYSK